jgi:serine/threonine-protein kinase RsbW
MARKPRRPSDDVTVLVLHRLGSERLPASGGDAAGIELRTHVRSSASMDQLDQIHDALARFWSRLGSAPEEVWRMLFELAVAEVAANVIEHARPEVMSMRLGLDAGSVVAEFSYIGPGWTSSAAAYPDPMAERGRGLFLTKTAIDDVQYERIGSTVRWRLIKKYWT